MKKKWYELANRESRCFIYGTRVVEAARMLEYDYVARRTTPSVAGFIGDTEGSRWIPFGTKEVEIPVYESIKQASEANPDVDIVINFQTFRSAYQGSVEALKTPGIKTLVIIAEGMPEKQTKSLIKIAKEQDKWIIGPNTVGGIIPGCIRIGNSGGEIENIIISKMHREGPVGLVCVSGGLFNELANLIAGVTDGICEAVPVGGDTFPGSTMLDHLLRLEANPKVKILVMLGELGGREEYRIVQALKEKRITKPLVALVCGTCQSVLPEETQFGHSGAKASEEAETAQAKNKALAEAGAIVPANYGELAAKIAEVFQGLKDKGIIKEIEEPEVPQIPMDLAEAQKKGIVFVPALFHSTISDERGEVLRYAGYSVVELIEKGYEIEDVMMLLWQKRLPTKEEVKAIRDLIIFFAQKKVHQSDWDRGDKATVEAARAGIDIVSSVTAGLKEVHLNEENLSSIIKEQSSQLPLEVCFGCYLFSRLVDLIGHWLDVVVYGRSRASLVERASTLPELIFRRWFGKKPKPYEKELIKRIMMLLADNGPCVVGATTTIMHASAGKNLVQSIASGDSCIGSLFGGAITDAAQAFGEAVSKGMTAGEFIEHRKSIGKPTIPGIGHLVFSKNQPDSRLVSLIDYIKSTGIETPHLDFAKKVEKLTLDKRNTLILNVDGAVGMILCDLGFPTESLNAFFLLARTIGFIGHWFDQKRLKTGLYRTPRILAGYYPEPEREVPEKE